MLLTRGGRGRTYLLRVWEGMCLAQAKGRPITPTKVLLKKHEKPMKNGMILITFLFLTISWAKTIELFIIRGGGGWRVHVYQINTGSLPPSACGSFLGVGKLEGLL